MSTHFPPSFASSQRPSSQKRGPQPENALAVKPSQVSFHQTNGDQVRFGSASTEDGSPSSPNNAAAPPTEESSSLLDRVKNLFSGGAKTAGQGAKGVAKTGADVVGSLIMGSILTPLGLLAILAGSLLTGIPFLGFPILIGGGAAFTIGVNRLVNVIKSPIRGLINAVKSAINSFKGSDGATAPEAPQQ